MAPWVVVRRAAAPVGRIAVGVRGATRSERYATEVVWDDVCAVVTPEDLSHVASAPVRELPALRTLDALRPILDDTALPWGPTGSVGFELATGLPTATPVSDLDLLVRVSSDLSQAMRLLSALHRELCSRAVRVDCQVETPCGAVALAELVHGRREILVRTAEGPRLIARTVSMS